MNNVPDAVAPRAQERETRGVQRRAAENGNRQIIIRGAVRDQRHERITTPRAAFPSHRRRGRTRSLHRRDRDPGRDA